MDSQLHAAVRAVQRLTRQYANATSEADGARRAVDEQQHQPQLRDLQAAADSSEAQHAAEVSEWATEAAAVREEISRLDQQHAELASRTSDLATVCERLAAVVDQQQAEAAATARSTSAAELTNLPLPCLRLILAFGTRADLARAVCTSYNMRRGFDRGSLWSGLTLEVVRSVISAQRVAAAAVEAKKRALGGLTQEFHSSNFLAACARTSIPSSPLSGNERASPSPCSPSGLADLPPTATSEILVTLPKPIAANKSEVFTRALAQLQRQVDPALSDFEDLSLKLASHQRIVHFLETQSREQMHQIGQTTGCSRIALGTALDSLTSQQQTNSILARSIASLETEIAAEHARQSEIAIADESTRRQLQTASNLRRTVDSLIAANLPPEEAEAHAHAQAQGDEAREAQQQEAAALAEAIVTLKAQKKVLAKVARTMHAEHAQAKAEKEEFASKLQKLREQLASVAL